MAAMAEGWLSKLTNPENRKKVGTHVVNKLTKSLAIAGQFINEDLGAENIAEGHEESAESSVVVLVRHTVDE